MTDIEALKKEFSDLKYEIHTCLKAVDLSKKSYLQKFLYFFFDPLFDIGESIIILCENEKFHPAKILLRSLVEAHIQINYCTRDESMRRTGLFLLDGQSEKIKLINDVDGFIVKYPSSASNDPANLFSKLWLEGTRRMVQNEQKLICKSFSLKEGERDLDLKAKAMKCDNNSDISNAGHFEQIYILMYRLLSQPSHLGIAGLEMYGDRGASDKITSKDDNSSYFLPEMVGICTAFIKDLYEYQVIETQIPDAVRTIEEFVLKFRQG